MGTYEGIMTLFMHSVDMTRHIFMFITNHFSANRPGQDKLSVANMENRHTYSILLHVLC